MTGSLRANTHRAAGSRRSLRRPTLLAASLVLVFAPVGIGAKAGEGRIPKTEGSPGRTGSVCSKYASTSGKDAAPGGRDRPYRTVVKLASTLSPGQIGCLLGGTFIEDVTLRRGGRSGRRIVLRSAPGFRATLRGRLWIADSANYVTFEFLNLDGRNRVHLPSPAITGDWVTFRNDDVTNHRAGTGPRSGRGICFNLGFPGYGVSLHARIERNRIHDCGISDNHNHGIYLGLARDTVITDNYIYDNGDRGIQLYPDADGTTIEHNVIDGNGTGIAFGGDHSGVSENNIIRWNIISNSVKRWNVESWYSSGTPPGTGNTVSHNCLFASNSNPYYDSNGGIAVQVGFSASSNRVAKPRYVDRARKNFRLRAQSPCRRYAPRAHTRLGLG